MYLNKLLSRPPPHVIIFSIDSQFDYKPIIGMRGQRALCSCHLTNVLVPIHVPILFSKLLPFAFVGLHEIKALWPHKTSDGFGVNDNA
jgi:hypothetical protein